MSEKLPPDGLAPEAVETQEWLESLSYVLQHSGAERVRHLLDQRPPLSQVV